MLAGSQGFHPVGDPRDRSGKTPAHDKDGDSDNHQYLKRYPNEDSAPDAKDLRANVSGVVGHNDATEDIVAGGMQRHCHHIYALEADAHVSTFVAIRFQGICQQPGRSRQ